MAPKCRICENIYNGEEKAPLSLPCGHTFCRECVGRLLNGGSSLKCSICRRTHNVPAGGDSFPVNFAILEASVITSTVDEPQDTDAPTDHVTLIIRDLTDRTFRLKVPLNAKIREVKEALLKDHGFVPQNTRLLFRGRRLDDHKTITSYNIQTGNIIQITTTYLGGRLRSLLGSTTAATPGSPPRRAAAGPVFTPHPRPPSPFSALP